MNHAYSLSHFILSNPNATPSVYNIVVSQRVAISPTVVRSRTHVRFHATKTVCVRNLYSVQYNIL